LDFPRERVHLNSNVEVVKPGENGTVVLHTNGHDEIFDHVILATHGDEALEMVRSGATKQEIGILSGFRTSKNIAILHSDLSLMPKRHGAWSAWNYITESPFPPSKTMNVSRGCLTYWMNRLQHISEARFGAVLVTLNPLFPPDPRKVQGIWEYTHPLYNAQAIRSQTLLPQIQNSRGISYCGAWTKYGFHEDGFSSGLSAAVNHLGAGLPFKLVDSAVSRRRKPTRRWRNYAWRIVLLTINVMITTMAMMLEKLVDAIDRRLATRRKVE
jgi:predicted NAD/FAD-binding protein